MTLEPQTVLEGVADLVIQANSLEECLALCYGRNVAGSPCLAGMFFVEVYIVEYRDIRYVLYENKCTLC